MSVKDSVQSGQGYDARSCPLSHALLQADICSDEKTGSGIFIGSSLKAFLDPWLTSSNLLLWPLPAAQFGQHAFFLGETPG